ncbi:MAG: PIN domain-containing protein [Deltaproteobacteria bacterium]|nr:PIN domain-containing protein [Deltaproteobacteria bacterium]
MTKSSADCVVDTFAWVEYFSGSRLGNLAAGYLNSGRTLTPTIVMAELAAKYARERNPRWNPEYRFVLAKSMLVEFTLDIALGSGRVREQMRAANPGAGLVDAIIYETARAHGVPVLTGDPHFKGMPHVVFLE